MPARAPKRRPPTTPPSTPEPSPRWRAPTRPSSFKLARPDGSQPLSAIDIALPEGLTGRLAGVPYCPEANIAQARSRERPNMGAVEQAAPSCPAATEVGTVTARRRRRPRPLLRLRPRLPRRPLQRRPDQLRLRHPRRWPAPSTSARSSPAPPPRRPQHAKIWSARTRSRPHCRASRSTCAIAVKVSPPRLHAEPDRLRSREPRVRRALHARQTPHRWPTASR